METHKKIANNNQPAGGDVREMLGAWGGGMEVTPYARIRNLVGRRRRAAINCRLPLFWVLKAQKKSNNNQPVGGDVGGARGTTEGHGSDPSRPPSHVGQAAAPGGL